MGAILDQLFDAILGGDEVTLQKLLQTGADPGAIDHTTATFRRLPSRLTERTIRRGWWVASKEWGVFRPGQAGSLRNSSLASCATGKRQATAEFAEEPVGEMGLEFSLLGAKNRPRIWEECFPWRAELNQMPFTRACHTSRKRSLIRAIERLHPGACLHYLKHPVELKVGDLCLWDWTLTVTRTMYANQKFSATLLEQIQVWCTKHLSSVGCGETTDGRFGESAGRHNKDAVILHFARTKPKPQL